VAAAAVCHVAGAEGTKRLAALSIIGGVDSRVCAQLEGAGSSAPSLAVPFGLRQRGKRQRLPLHRLLSPAQRHRRPGCSIPPPRR